MKKSSFTTPTALLLACLFVLLSAPAVLAISAFTPPTGAAARLVVGQPDFNTSQAASGVLGLDTPTSIAVDPTTGKVFVADQMNHRVLRYDDFAGLTNGAPAEGVLGQPNLTSQAMVTSQTGMYKPAGVAVDAVGRLWVADSGNNRILRFDHAASLPNGAPADGVLGQPDFTSAYMTAAINRTQTPQGVAVDAAGRLWVADWRNNRILRFDNAAAKPNGADADGVLGQPNYTSTSCLTNQNNTCYPTHLSVDPAGRLWAADCGNNRVLRYENAAAKSNGGPADGVLGQPDFTSNTGGEGIWCQLGPLGVSADDAGRLWVSESNRNRVLRFDNAASKANGAAADGVLGQPDLANTSPNSGDLSAHSLYTPAGVFFDPLRQTLWVADSGNNRVMAYAEPILTVLGYAQHAADGSPQWPPAPVLHHDASPSTVEGTDFGLVDLARGQTVTHTFTLSNPLAVAVDLSAGVQLTGDNAADYQVLFQPPAGLAPGGTAAFQVRFTPSGAGLRVAQVRIPTGLGNQDPYTFTLQGTAGEVFTPADYQAARLVLGQPTLTSSTPAFTRTGLEQPYDMAVDPTTGKIFVSDYNHNRILRFASRTALLNGAQAEVVFGSTSFTWNTGVDDSAGKLRHPAGIFIDPDGRMWVADSGHNRVLRFDSAAWASNGDTAESDFGNFGFFYAPGTGPDHMRTPMDVFMDAQGCLWVADSGNHRILRFDNAVHKMDHAADAVLGQADLYATTAGTSRTGLSFPSGLAVDSAGRLWVADSGNHRILRFDHPSQLLSGGAADAVLGQADFTSAVPGGGSTRFTSPSGVWVDPAGRLWVSDTGNHRILHFDQAAAQDGLAPANGVLGQPDLSGSAANSDGLSAHSLNGPRGVMYDTALGTLWVGDAGNNRVLAHLDPVMQVFGNSAGWPLTPIPSGDSTPSALEGSDFGLVDLDSADVITHTFTISNPGPFSLDLTGSPLVQLDGPAAADFHLVKPPTRPLPAGGVTTFQVSFSPSIEGLRSVILSIPNSEPARSPYTFTLQGTGVVASPVTIQLDDSPQVLTRQTSATFTFSSTNALSFECSLDDGAYTTCTSPYLTPALPDGTHSFQVQGVGAQDRRSNPAAHTWTIDSQSPTLQINGAPLTLTNTSRATFTFSGADPHAPLAFTCALDAGLPQPCASPYLTPALPDGPHAIQLQAIDLAGNDSPALSFGWTIDSQPPALQIDSAPLTLTNISRAVFTFHGADLRGQQAPDLSYACSLDGQEFTPCSSPYTASELLDGVHTFRVRAIDPAGNASLPAVHAWTLDTQPPAGLRLLTPLPGTWLPFATDYHHPLFSGTAEAGVLVSVWGEPPAGRADGAGLLCSAVADQDGDWSCRASTSLPSGENRVALLASDPAGNTAAPLWVTFMIGYQLNLPVVLRTGGFRR